MYESITYTELKGLPKEQKSDAWKELKTMYSTQKELAEKLGVSPSIVYNMISRYAKEEGDKELKIVEKPIRTRKSTKKQVVKEEQNTIIAITKPPVTETTTTLETKKVENETFSIFINKTMTGDDAQLLLNGIGSTLLKNQKYAIEVKITEM